MGPCHSSSKKKPIQQQQNQALIPQPEPQQLLHVPQEIPNLNRPQFSPEKNQAESKDLHPPLSVHGDEKLIRSIENTPYKLNEENVGSSGLKKSPNNRYGHSEENLVKSNVISKVEPNHNQDVKMGSHFYYNQKENETNNKGNLVEERIRDLDYEEHEFKEPIDIKTSLHSNQINRREIFSELKKNKFIQSKNTGDSDEPDEMIFDHILV